MMSADNWANYDAQKEEAERRWLRTRPSCNLCGEPIADDYCYVITEYPDHEERMLSCVHGGCVRRYKRRHKDNFMELIENILDNYYDRTPSDLIEEDEY